MRVRDYVLVYPVFILPICCSKDLDLVGIPVTLEASPHAMCLQHCGVEIQLANFQLPLSFLAVSKVNYPPKTTRDC